MKEKQTTVPYQWVYYCDFWISHNQSQSCDCPKKFDMFPITFQSKLFDKFPHIKYNNQITHSMRLIILGK